MAAITDKFRRGAPAFSTTLAADKAQAAGTMTLQSAAGVPTTTAIDFTVGRVDSNGTKTPALKAVYTGLLSGTTVSSLVLVEGTDQLHKAGTPVEITFTAATWNDAITGILNQHNEDGSHSSITTTGYTQASGTFTVPNNAVKASQLDTAAIKLGQAKITSSFTSTNTAVTAITGLSVTATVPAGGRDVEVSFTGGCSSSAAAGNNWTLEVYDSTTSTVMGGTGIISIPTASFTLPCTFFVTIPAPSAGTHTYQIRYSQSASGTFTANATTTYPATMQVKLT